jgi:hypothetical protein
MNFISVPEPRICTRFGARTMPVLKKWTPKTRRQINSKHQEKIKSDPGKWAALKGTKKDNFKSVLLSK